MRQADLHADVRTLFSTPTLASLAVAVGGESGFLEVPPNLIPAACEEIEPGMLPLVSLSEAEIERIVGLVPGGAGNVQDIYPLAPLQEGILFHHLSSEEGDPYLKHVLFGLESEERLRAFLWALEQVIARHDILRTG